jgi:hypothetical protein
MLVPVTVTTPRALAARADRTPPAAGRATVARRLPGPRRIGDAEPPTRALAARFAIHLARCLVMAAPNALGTMTIAAR